MEEAMKPIWPEDGMRKRIAELERDNRNLHGLNDTLRQGIAESEAELAALKGRRCGGCEHDGVCGVQRTGWTKFRMQPFSCCCWAEKDTP